LVFVHRAASGRCTRRSMAARNSPPWWPSSRDDLPIGVACTVARTPRRPPSAKGPFEDLPEAHQSHLRRVDDAVERLDALVAYVRDGDRTYPAGNTTSRAWGSLRSKPRGTASTTQFHRAR
jgi:hypothetical protein